MSVLLIFSTSPTGAVSPQRALLTGKFIFWSSCKRQSQAVADIDFGSALSRALTVAPRAEESNAQSWCRLNGGQTLMRAPVKF